LKLFNSFVSTISIFTSKNVKMVGLILPAQRKIFKVDISEWGWESFWDKLKDCIDQKSKRASLYTLPLLEYAIFESERQRVGTHIHKIF